MTPELLTYILNTYDFDTDSKQLMNNKTKRMLKHYELSDSYCLKNDIDLDLDWIRIYWNIKSKRVYAIDIYHIFYGFFYDDIKSKCNIKY